MRWVVAVVLLVGCHRGSGASGAKPPSCRAVAQATERFVRTASEPEREAMLRFAVEVIDLCQAPGLSGATRKCVASATTAAEARACPALPVVPLHAASAATSSGDGGDDGEDGEDPEGLLDDGDVFDDLVIDPFVNPRP